jgi:hypothetical protein
VTWTLNDRASASNPGKLRVSRLRWLVHYPGWPTILATGLLLSIALAFRAHAAFSIPVALFVFLNSFYWVRVGEHFRYGCANPGVVVSLDPMLIAVSTDLTKGLGRFPVIKIVPKRLGRIAGESPKIGTRLATVALYMPSINNQPHWSDFDPRPADSVTANLSEIRRLISTFSEEDWRELYQGLQQVEKPYRPGLYRVQPSNVLG